MCAVVWADCESQFTYDLRGRKTAEYGTALQPALFAYDDAYRQISLTTFRVDSGDITTDPAGRTDGDTTRAYDEATGLLTRKTYPDATHEDFTYNSFNQLHTRTDAESRVITHSYNALTGLPASTSFSDGTPTVSFTHNHLGLLTEVSDASGTCTIAYNEFNELLSENLPGGGKTHLVTEAYDALGRGIGYVYSKDAATQQTVAYGYDTTSGRLASAAFLHGGVAHTFSYGYLADSHLLETLGMPNNMSLTLGYEAKRNLLTSQRYKRSSTGVVERDYTYDELGRVLTRRIARQGTVENDSFAYNPRSELTAASLASDDFTYDYDNIGNRKTAEELAEEIAYTANEVNQYTGIIPDGGSPFVPEFDLAGNQILVQTNTGVWTVEYDANNRPVKFTGEDEESIIECGYDYLGRRFSRKVTVSSVVTLHQRYIYRGYLQIACVDILRAAHPALWFITWDPLEPTATRPLAIQKDGTWYCYGHDLTKNVMEIFGPAGYIRTTYRYTPFGSVTEAGDVTQPIQWSSECCDGELALVYYGFRYYSPETGRWLSRDPLGEEGGMDNLYGFCHNSPANYVDVNGEWAVFVRVGLWLLSRAGRLLKPKPRPKLPAPKAPAPRPNPRPKPKGCMPCVPPKGTKLCEVAPPGSRQRGIHRAGGGKDCGHCKIWTVLQQLAPTCGCFWSKPVTIEDCQKCPPGTRPGGPPKGRPGGGGPRK